MCPTTEEVKVSYCHTHTHTHTHTPLPRTFTHLYALRSRRPILCGPIVTQQRTLLQAIPRYDSVANEGREQKVQRVGHTQHRQYHHKPVGLLREREREMEFDWVVQVEM